MEKEIKKEVKNVASSFVKLSELTGKDVLKWSRVPVKLSRRTGRNGITANMQVIISQVNLIISVVSTEIVSGATRRLRYYKPERMVSLLYDLDLPQIDERGNVITEWVFNAPIRFVKGKTQSGDDYYQLEILFKQYKYESVFLNADQVSILESLDKAKELKDFRNKNFKLVWEDRPEIINDIGEDIFEF